MDMKFQLKTSMQQRLVMTPKLQQALKLLQVPTLELEHILKQEIMQNPLLEEVDFAEDDEEETPEEASEDSAEEPAEEEPTTDLDLDEYLDDSFKVMGWEPEREDLDERYERVAVAPENGMDLLITQLHLAVDGDLDTEIGEYLIGNLNPDGFLTVDLEEVARVFEVDAERVQSVLDVIQSFDPPGIGARGLQEALLLQLKARNQEDSMLADIVRDHFDALKNRKFAEIARELRITPREVQEMAEEIGHLDPRPGLSTLGNEARYVTPDLVVEKVDGEYVVYLNDSNIPRLRISQAYVEELNRSKGTGDTETREFILGKLNSAKWLIQTIEQRRRTIVKVMQCIVEEQREFFDKGPVALKPLTLQQVATQIGMHESTVSRVTTNKYVQTPRGVFELKYFFSSSLDTDDGDSMSSKAAKTRISEIIVGEEKSRPLSDQKIVDMLKADGLNIARRTVAKYREQLGILPARMRKTY
jgi:RNA polymerase sigma-54 factor